MEIKEYDAFEAKIKGLEDICNFLPDCSTDEGYDKSKRVSLDVGKVLTALEKTRKEIKAPALERCRFIDSEAKELKERIESAQLPHKQAYKSIEDEKKRIEEERKAHISQRFETLYNLPNFCREANSATLTRKTISELEQEEFLDCDEKTGFALTEKKRILAEMEQICGAQVTAEEQAAELKRLQKEAAEREQKEREEKIAKEAAEAERNKVDAERKAEAEAAQRQQQLIEQQKQDAIAAQKKAEDDARQAKIDAERRAKEAVEAERKAAEDKRLTEIAEAEKREANKKHRAFINNEALKCFVDKAGISEAEAKKVIEAIAKREIKHIAISY